MGIKVKRVRGLKDGDGIEGTGNEEGHEDGQWRRNGNWSVHDFLSAPHYLNNSIDLLRPQHPYVSFIWTHTHKQLHGRTDVISGVHSWPCQTNEHSSVFVCLCVTPEEEGSLRANWHPSNEWYRPVSAFRQGHTDTTSTCRAAFVFWSTCVMEWGVYL